MTLYESIFNRRSCRKYEAAPLSVQTLDEIKAAIAGFDRLHADVVLDYRFVTRTKGMFHVEAPHYLIVSGTGKERELESAGFLFEQLVLWFNANGVGSVWLGKTRDAEPNKGGKDLITIAFGTPAGPLQRTLAEFKRKPIQEITNAPQDERIKAAHLAPSGMNFQPWYFEKRGDTTALYLRTLKGPYALVYKLKELDMGIVLCHYALACKQLGKPFSFARKQNGTAIKDHVLFGEIGG